MPKLVQKGHEIKTKVKRLNVYPRRGDAQTCDFTLPVESGFDKKATPHHLLADNGKEFPIQIYESVCEDNETHQIKAIFSPWPDKWPR